MRRLPAPSPRQLLILGWLGFMAYAFPGYMSFDSAFQLRMSRSGYLIDGHPPFMAAMWRFVELFVAGPVGMLVIQTTAFLIGAYLVFRTLMSPKRAAIVATLVLWFPPIASVMAVIWKDSQMTAFLILGFGLLIQDRRRDHVLGLLAILVATLMRHNALVMTGPILVFAFRWDRSYGWIKSTVIAVLAWAAITLVAGRISAALTDEEQHIWHTSLALCDMTMTLRYEPVTISDEELAREAPGVTFLVHDVHDYIRNADLTDNFINDLWKMTYKVIALPRTEAERTAVTNAWKKIVLGHPRAYAAYRWEIVRRLMGWSDEPDASPVYNWFTDIQDPLYSASKIDHDAAPAHFQDVLRREIHVVGTTPIFSVVVYLVLSVVLLPFAIFDRRVLGLLASGITSELVLVVIAPTTDWRYSYWLLVTVVFAVVMLVARRMNLKRPAIH
jgi:hypothetical protein